MLTRHWSAELAERARGLEGLADFRLLALAMCREIVGGDRGVFTEMQRPGAITVLDVDSESLDIINYCESNVGRYAADIRPVFSAALRGGGCVDHEVFSSRDRHELPIFCEVVRPQRVRSSLILVPRWRGEGLGMMRLERTGRRAFTTTDLARALRLLPTIELGLLAFRTLAARVVAVPRLSPREADVARHVARGLTTPQIALVLGTSPLTVRNQISRIFDKIGVSSRAELASWVSNSGHGAFVPSRVS
jgi:DNA-binding CsgD family transcriptional regulator